MTFYKSKLFQFIMILTFGVSPLWSCRIGGNALRGLSSSGSTSTTTIPWVVNGEVMDFAFYNGIAYLGGSFSSIGPKTGYGVLAKSGTNAVNGLDALVDDFQPDVLPIINDVVMVSLPDGSGGFFIGGQFTKVGGLTRNYLAQIDANGNVTDWNPSADGTVEAMVSDGSGTLYVAGSFTQIGAQTRNNIAAVNETTGAVTSFDPNLDDGVNALALDGTTLYIGGYFTDVNSGTTRNNLAAVSTSTGTATSWNPAPNGTVNALELDSGGGLLYVGGSFSSIGATPSARSNLAAIQLSDGEETTWNPGPNNQVLAMSLDLGSSLIYVCGTFTSIGATPAGRNYVAAVQTTDGEETAWNPSASSLVYTLKYDSTNSILYVGGWFTSIGGQSRARVAALNASDATATSWDLTANDTVRSFSVDPTSGNVFIGGEFVSVAGETRNRLAAYDVSTGTVTSWNPNASGTVYEVEVDSSSGTLYVGGSFTSIGGTTRNRLAAIQLPGTSLTSWNPNSSGAIRAMLLDTDSSRLYVGGLFTTFGGGATTRNRIAAIQTSDGVPVAGWDPNANSEVYALTLNSDKSLLYIGGIFSTLEGGVTTRNRVAAVQTSDGAVTSFNPNFGTGNVYSLLEDSTNNLLYVGGDYSSVNGGTTRNRLAAVSTLTSTANSFDPDIPGALGTEVNSMVLDESSGLLIIGGNFSSLNGGATTRNDVAAVRVSDGGADSWNPNMQEGFEAHFLMMDSGKLWIGGNMGTIEERVVGAFTSISSP